MKLPTNSGEEANLFSYSRGKEMLSKRGRKLWAISISGACFILLMVFALISREDLAVAYFLHTIDRSQEGFGRLLSEKQNSTIKLKVLQALVREDRYKEMLLSIFIDQTLHSQVRDDIVEGNKAGKGIAIVGVTEDPDTPVNLEGWTGFYVATVTMTGTESRISYPGQVCYSTRPKAKEEQDLLMTISNLIPAMVEKRFKLSDLPGAEFEVKSEEAAVNETGIPVIHNSKPRFDRFVCVIRW